MYTSIVFRVFATGMLIDMFSSILLAESAISTVFTSAIIIDAVSFPSLILSSGPNDYLNFAFLRAIAAFFAYARLERRMFVHIFSHNRLLVKLCLKCLTLFYTLAASIQMLEVPGDLLSVGFREKWSSFGDWNFMNSSYFIIVTLSTVGYGDFSPRTVQGRIYALFIIIIGIIVFSSVVTELVEQANRDRGGGYFIKNSRTRHVIVTGNPTMVNLVHFVSEFYSDSRQTNVSAKIVVLVEKPAWSDTEWFQYIARNQFLQARLQFLMGSASNPSDLQRARIYTADAVFVLTTPPTGEDPSIQDTRTVMIILAIRNARNGIPIYAQTLLEGNNLQTHVALTTISSFSGVSDRDRAANDTDREKCARYPGLFYSVLQSEYQNLPKAHQRTGRRYLQDILSYHQQRDHCVDIHSSEDSLGASLKLSQHVCLQEIQMSLISGNIKANGVGTLLSNMYLDVQAAKLTKEDPPWLYEYHMGAAASLVYSIVPEELDGVCVKEIACDMFHIGLLLIATTDSVTVRPQPVLSTNEVLRQGDLAMLLSYHDSEYVGAAFYLVALRYARGELQHMFNPNTEANLMGAENNLDSAMSDGYSLPNVSRVGMPSQTPRIDIQPATAITARPTTTRTQNWLPTSLSFMNFSASVEDLDALADAEEQANLLPTPGTVCEKRSDGYIPDKLRGHIIIAMEGDAPLHNLTLLLRNLWHKDNRKVRRRAKRSRIVVIHPSIGEEVRKRYARFERDSLFFVEGSPASRTTWRKAKLSSASAVASVADITQRDNLSDARTIFTLLTLEVTTANDQDLFICSELVDEKSLEYLREPIHARRRGASLGEPVERLMSTYVDGPLFPSGQGSMAGPVPSIRVGPRGDTTDEITPSTVGQIPVNAGRAQNFFEMQSMRSRVDGDCEPGPANPDWQMGRFESLREGGTTGHPTRLQRLTSKAKPNRKVGMKLAATKPPMSVLSGEAKSITGNLGPEAVPHESFEIGADPNNRPGAARARRSTLFSRSRYASGELLVQSSAITLLAREYIEPGFVNFFTNILGTDVSHLGMKIRLVRIPETFFDAERGFTEESGRPLIRYNDVVEILFSLGVTPLGIYRSGNAPVLIPWKMRRKRGPSIVYELEPFLEQVARESDISRTLGKGLKSSGSIIKGIIDKLRDIDPAKRREIQGQEEIHGKVKTLFLDESSDEFNPNDDDDEIMDAQPSSSRFDPAAGVNDEQMEPKPNAAHKRWSFNVFGGENCNNSEDDGRMADWGQGFDREGENAPEERTDHGKEPPRVPGRAKCLERPIAENLLPYVYTMPEPNTWCAPTDGIYILCDPSFDLPSKWTETANDIQPPNTTTDSVPKTATTDTIPRSTATETMPGTTTTETIHPINTSQPCTSQTTTVTDLTPAPAPANIAPQDTV